MKNRSLLAFFLTSYKKAIKYAIQYMFTPLYLKYMEQNCSCQFCQQYIKKIFFLSPKNGKFMTAATKIAISCVTFTRTCVKISMNQIFLSFLLFDGFFVVFSF